MKFRTFSNPFVVLVIVLAASAGNADARGFGGGLGRGGAERAGDALGNGFGPGGAIESHEGNAGGQALPNNVPAESARPLPPPSIENVPAENAAPVYRGGSYDEVGNYHVDGEDGGGNVQVLGGVQVAPAAPAWTATAVRNRAAAAATSTLPCVPQVIDTGSTTYYVCDNVYYQLAYGPDGAIYTPVQ